MTIMMEARCGMSKEEFDLRWKAMELREEGNSWHRAAQYQGICYAGYIAAGDGCMERAAELDRQADAIKASVPYVIRGADGSIMGSYTPADKLVETFKNRL